MPIDLLSFAYTLFKDFGVNVLLGGIVIYLLWKLITNHLHHIGMDVKECIDKIDNLSTEVKDSKKELNGKIDASNAEMASLGERISFVEGKTGSKQV